MRKAQLLLPALLLVLLTMACAQKVTAPTTPPQVPALAAAPAPAVVPTTATPAWKIEREKTLAAAKQEGVVSFAGGGLGSGIRSLWAQALKGAYRISTEFVDAKGPEMAERVLRERRVGIYNYDVAMLGGSTTINTLKPAGMVAPLEPALILPEVTDPELIKKTWEQGKLYWADNDRTMLVPMVSVRLSIAINTNLVKEGEIKSYRDLLNPRWRGKLVLSDPTISGTGSTWLSFADAVLGWDYVVELAKAEPIVMRDQRLMVDWLAHGKAAMVLAPNHLTLAEYIQIGAPVKAIVPVEGALVVGGVTSNISIFNKPPHPNAAKIAINWYVSKEGQSFFVGPMAAQSLRLDVPTDHLPPEQIRQPGVKYFVVEGENVRLAQPAQQQKAKELFGPLMK